MHYKSFIVSSLLLFFLSACSDQQATIDSSNSPLADSSASNPTVIDLTQVGCQFLETESKDYQYQPKNADDCKQINSDSLAARESGLKTLELKPGKHIFRVTNSNVPYPQGFYVRGKGVKKVSLPKVSGGGLTQGTTKDYEIDLVAGEYIFSCPLNPTPDYPIVVN